MEIRKKEENILLIYLLMMINKYIRPKSIGAFAIKCDKMLQEEFKQNNQILLYGIEIY